LAAATAVFEESFQTSADDPETVVRTRGLFTVMSDQAGSTERPFGAFGIAVVSVQAATVGITALPLPYANADSDLWFVHGYWAATIQASTAVAFANTSRDYMIDSKAMRKVSPDERVVVVIENGDATGGIRYNWNIRLLGKVA